MTTCNAWSPASRSFPSSSALRNDPGWGCHVTGDPFQHIVQEHLWRQSWFLISSELVVRRSTWGHRWGLQEKTGSRSQAPCSYTSRMSAWASEEGHCCARSALWSQETCSWPTARTASSLLVPWWSMKCPRRPRGELDSFSQKKNIAFPKTLGAIS